MARFGRGFPGRPIVTRAPVAAAAQSANLGLVTETSSAHPITSRKEKTLGLAVDTSSALAFSALKSVSLGLASETTSVFGLGKAKSQAVGLATQTSSALDPSSSKQKGIGLPEETSAAQGISASRSLTLGLASTTSSALGLSKAKRKTLGLASETDTAFPVLVAGAALEFASETTSALTIRPRLHAHDTWTFMTPARIVEPHDPRPGYGILQRMTFRSGVALVRHANGQWEEFETLPQLYDGTAEFWNGSTGFDFEDQLELFGFGHGTFGHGRFGESHREWALSPVRIYRGGREYSLDATLREELLAAVTAEEPDGYGAYMTSHRRGEFECIGDEIMRSGTHSTFQHPTSVCRTPNGHLQTGYGHGAYGQGAYGHKHEPAQ